MKLFLSECRAKRFHACTGISTFDINMVRMTAVVTVVGTFRRLAVNADRLAWV